MNKQTVKDFLLSRDINVSTSQLEQLEKFMEMTLITNEKFNLTAIKDIESFWEKMILDSALGLFDLDLSNKKVIDVGTGAGFPGVVLKILQPTSDITLLDSTKKKIDYLSEYSKANNLGLKCVTSRAEDFAKSHREQFDFAYARAVAALPILLELIIPMLKVGGTFIAMKGPGVEGELNLSNNAMKKLGCRLQKMYVDTLPECGESRSIIYIIKEKETNKKYPRDYSEIKKSTL